MSDEDYEGTRVVINARGPAARQTEAPLLDGERRGDVLSQRIVEAKLAQWKGSGSSPADANDAMISVPHGLISWLADEALTMRDAHRHHEHLDFQMLDRTNLRARHLVGATTRIFRPDGSDFCRVKFALRLQDDPEGERPYEFFADVPSEAMGKLLDAARQDENVPVRYSVEAGGRYGTPRMDGRTPRWAGSHSFGPVLEQARKVSRAIPMHLGGTNNAPRQVMAVAEAGELERAHVVRIDPEQVEVLPEWESGEELIEYALEAELPFETVYFDFEREGGLAPGVGFDMYGNPLTLTGALMFRRVDTGALTVAPIGWPEDARIERGSETWSRYETTGWFCFDREVLRNARGDLIAASTMPLVLNALDGTSADATILSADGCANSLAGPGDEEKPMLPWPGYAVLPTNRRDMIVTFGEQEAAEQLVWWGDMIWALVKKAMAALTIVEAEECVLVDAPMEKRDRKRAEKRGWPIAQQVVIRPRRKYVNERERVRRETEESRYSHRFWRRGTHAHYPLGTRMADTRPDLVKACPRLDPETNCGFCRRVWHPPCIVGPDDKPLVLKTLVTKRGKAS